MEITATQKQKINEIGKKYDLRLAVLHGSFANGKARDVLGFHIIHPKNLFMNFRII